MGGEDAGKTFWANQYFSSLRPVQIFRPNTASYGFPWDGFNPDVHRAIQIHEFRLNDLQFLKHLNFEELKRLAAGDGCNLTRKHKQ